MVAGVAALVSAALVGGCGSGGKRPATTVSTTNPTAAAGARDRWGTVWLCRPGLADNPCLSGLATTAVRASGASRIVPARPAANPRVDCFYVYPTISGQSTINANLQVGLRERLVANAQASRFSQVCRVFAPVYPQITLAALQHPARITRADALAAYDGVLTAFHDYLAHYNDGRGIVFIGHSQGAVILTRLLRREVDPDATLRRRVVSALLLGGNVTVAKGRSVGGSFLHIPACASRRQTGCVVAYSSFTSRPLTNSQFGRTTSDAGVGLLAPRTPRSEPSDPLRESGFAVRRSKRARSVCADARTRLHREHARREDAVVRLCWWLHRPLPVIGQRQLAPGHPQPRPRRPATRLDALPATHPGVASARRQHRPRQSRQPRPGRGSRLPTSMIESQRTPRGGHSRLTADRLPRPAPRSASAPALSAVARRQESAARSSSSCTRATRLRAAEAPSR